MEIAISLRCLIASTAGFISRVYYNVYSWLELAANRNLRGCSDLRSFVADQEARYSPEDTPLPASRERLLGQIRHLREEFERQLPMR